MDEEEEELHPWGMLPGQQQHKQGWAMLQVWSLSPAQSPAL